MRKINVETINGLRQELVYSIEELPLLGKLLSCKDSQKRQVNYLNIPCAFDIETTSFYEGKEKRATMYIWQMSIAGLIVIGRTWNEFVLVLEAITRDFELKLGELHLVFYVQSLAYEFQFMRKWLDWSEVFAVDYRDGQQNEKG